MGSKWITNNPVDLSDGSSFIQHLSKATTTPTDYVFPYIQTGLYVKNEGDQAVLLTANGVTYNIPPGDGKSVTASIKTITIVSTLEEQPIRIDAWGDKTIVSNTSINAYALSGVQIPVIYLYKEDPTNIIKAALRRGFAFIFISELVAAINGQGTLPPKPIILTVDNGYTELNTVINPVIQQYKIKCNVDLITDFHYGLPCQNMVAGTACGWDVLRQLNATGLYEWHNHTQTHPNLASITSAQRQAEFANADMALRKELGISYKTTLFYPLGVYNQSVIQDVNTYGFPMAFTIRDESNTKTDRPSIIGDNPLRINRLIDITANALRWCYDDVIYDFGNDLPGSRNDNNKLGYWDFSGGGKLDLSGMAVLIDSRTTKPRSAITADYFRVDPKDLIYVRAQLWSQSQTTGNMTFQIAQYDANKAFLSNVVVRNYTTDSGGYVNFENDFALDANCRFIRLQLVSDATGDGILHVYSLTVRRRS